VAARNYARSDRVRVVEGVDMGSKLCHLGLLGLAMTLAGPLLSEAIPEEQESSGRRARGNR
jgi:hypothetical protein